MPLFIPGLTGATNAKAEFYMELALECTSLLSSQRNPISNTANISSHVYHSLLNTPTRANKPVSWAGFYFVDAQNAGELVLGPFQGKPACTRIEVGKGVCGKAAAELATVVVPDVHKFPGHIACDSASKSEIVVPLVGKSDGKVVGVFDVDASVEDAFDEFDRIGLEAIANMVVEASDF